MTETRSATSSPSRPTDPSTGLDDLRAIVVEFRVYGRSPTAERWLGEIERARAAAIADPGQAGLGDKLALIGVAIGVAAGVASKMAASPSSGTAAGA